VSGAREARLVVVYPRDLAGENAGLYGLHVQSLLELMPPLGWRVEAYSVLDPRFPAAALNADLTLLQMLGEPEAEGVILRRRDLGRPTVYEVTDNVLGVGDWLPPTHPARSPLVRQSLLYHAHIADATQMLVPALAELYTPVNPRSILLQPRTPYPAEPPAKPPGFVVGWSGSRSHSESLAAAAPAVVELCRRHPEATFAYMGDGAVFDEHFGATPAGQRQVHPFGDWEAQQRFVGGLHVGIAPMLPSPFNAARSDTRVGLYAGHAVAAVLQDAPPHRPHRERARIYTTTSELLETLDELFRDRDQVAALARAGRDWMERERSPEALGGERDRAYRELLARSAGRQAPPLPEPAVDGADQLAARLHRASGEDPERALAACRDLTGACPAYDQAHLLAAQCLERLGRDDEALSYVASVEASPAYADLFAELGMRVAARAGGGAAPPLRSPFRRARAARFGSPAEQAHAVLEHNPYDHFALASTVRRAERDGAESPELEPLYERLSMVAPEAVPAERRPARLEPFLPA
jgi:hypothetical protein